MPNNKEYDLVFEGGGAKGVLFIGEINRTTLYRRETKNERDQEVKNGAL